MTIQSVGLLDAIKTPSNPFPGLRPFESNESHLFFGRDEQIGKMLTKFAQTRFLAVVGTSGSGKSSLVRAGLIPALRSGMLSNAKGKWRIAVMRPSNDPMGNLMRALNAPDVFGSAEPENVAIQQAITDSTLRLGSRGLTEVAHQSLMSGDENLLVLVDQFEELFRHLREGRRTANLQAENEAADFVNLLLESIKSEANIYVVLTMRSDFLGDCSQFWGLPEAINDCQYLVPRLTRDQLREVIEGPVAVGGGQIAPRLVNQLLNDISDNQDQLPILQHALMRTWDHWQKTTLIVPTSGGNGSNADRLTAEQQWYQPIDLEHYLAIGGMAHALSIHADEAYKELPDDDYRQIAKKMFKALTGKGEDNREIRRPVGFRDLCEVIQAGPEQVKIVINAFRQPGRSFLMPPAEVTLHDSTLIDISHESLLRNWKSKSEGVKGKLKEKDKRLKQWLEDENESARAYLGLVEFSRRRFLLEGENLKEMLSWQERNSPHPAWAQRYAKGEEVFHQAIAYLEEQKHLTDQEFALTNMVIYAALVGFLLFLILLTHGLQIPNSSPSLPDPSQGVVKWAVSLTNASIYWAWRDALQLNQLIFDRWTRIENPFIKLSVLFVSILATMYFRLLLNQKGLREKLASIIRRIIRRNSSYEQLE